MDDTVTTWTDSRDGVNFPTLAAMPVSAFGIFRSTLALSTWGSLGIGAWTGDVRWFVASGAFGTLWWTADSLVEWAIRPLVDLLGQVIQGSVRTSSSQVGPSLEDTVSRLEAHIDNNAARAVQIQAALKLSDIYRAVYKDAVRAQAILALARTRFPDAPELPAPPDQQEVV